MSWNIDNALSEINFTVCHMMISVVCGRFENFDGVVEFDENNPENPHVFVEIDSSSLRK